MVSFAVGAKSARRSRPLLLKVGANTMVATSITINVVTSTINVTTSINKRLCQHEDDKSLTESTMMTTPTNRDLREKAVYFPPRGRAWLGRVLGHCIIPMFRAEL